MRIIPTRIHAMMDYLVGALLVVAPWLLGFANGGAAQWVPVILGLGVIAYSLVTRYEYSVAGMLSMPARVSRPPRMATTRVFIILLCPPNCRSTRCAGSHLVLAVGEMRQPTRGSPVEQTASPGLISRAPLPPRLPALPGTTSRFSLVGAEIGRPPQEVRAVPHYFRVDRSRRGSRGAPSV